MMMMMTNLAIKLTNIKLLKHRERAVRENGVFAAYRKIRTGLLLKQSEFLGTMATTTHRKD